MKGVKKGRILLGVRYLSLFINLALFFFPEGDSHYSLGLKRSDYPRILEKAEDRFRLGARGSEGCKKRGWILLGVRCLSLFINLALFFFPEGDSHNSLGLELSDYPRTFFKARTKQECDLELAIRSARSDQNGLEAAQA